MKNLIKFLVKMFRKILGFLPFLLLAGSTTSNAKLKDYSSSHSGNQTGANYYRHRTTRNKFRYIHRKNLKRKLMRKSSRSMRRHNLISVR